MLRHQDNITRVNIWFEDVYDLKVNLSYNDSNDFVGIMAHSDTCHPYLLTLNTVYMPLVIVIGLVGNFLSFLVLSTTHLRMRSSSYYLAALAVSIQGGSNFSHIILGFQQSVKYKCLVSFNLYFRYYSREKSRRNIALISYSIFFSYQWIGVLEVVLWPARNPDLSPLDYFLWGYLKNCILKHPRKIYI